MFLRIIFIFGWLMASCFVVTDSFASDRQLLEPERCRVILQLIVNSYQMSYPPAQMGRQNYTKEMASATRADALQDLYFKMNCDANILADEVWKQFIIIE